MVAHVLAVLGLAFYAFEVHRTVRRFGARRHGLIGGAAGSPRAHIAMAVFMALVFLLLPAIFPAVPVYVAPVGALINVVYLVIAIRYARRRSDERKAASGR